MHAEARAWLERTIPLFTLPPMARVLDVGGRDVNGTPRDLFPDALYLPLDAEPMECEGLPREVHAIVQDAREPFTFEVRATEKGWRLDLWLDPSRRPRPSFDVVVSTETLEHVEVWPTVLENMAEVLVLDGKCFVTAATDPRAPHSGVDGWDLRPGEWYGNVDVGELERLAASLFRERRIEVNRAHGDVYLWGVK